MRIRTAVALVQGFVLVLGSCGGEDEPADDTFPGADEPNDSECERAGNFCDSRTPYKVGKFAGPICTEFAGIIEVSLSCQDSQGRDGDLMCCHVVDAGASGPDGG